MFLSSQVGFKTNGVEPRKISKFNLENLFSVILNLINLSSVSYKSELTGAAGLLFNRIQIGFMDNATDLISDLKMTRAWYISAIRGGPRTSTGFRPKAWSFDKDCPFLLEAVMPVLDKHSETLSLVDLLFFHRIIFALLSADRVIVTPAKANYDTIRAPFKMVKDASKEDQIKQSEIVSACDSLGITPELFKEAYEHHVAGFHYEVLTSAGPNGQSTWTAHSDVRAWSKEPDIFTQLTTFLQESGMTFMLDDMEGTLRLPDSDIQVQRFPYLGRLSVIEEWGGKARIVAALDYWSQMALTPLHNTINSFLKELPADGSFNQDAIIRRVKEWTSNDKVPLNCYDLSAATDRIPVTLQSQILSHLMSSTSFGTAWQRMLTDRPYLTLDGMLYRYSVGQPMGARSSFPMLALVHHVIIQVAANRAKLVDFDAYGIIGDDSAITTTEVGDNYRKIMAAHGVAINFNKSIEHIQGALPAAEICKIVYVDGHQISNIPVKLICKTIRDGKLATQLQNEMVRRGHDLNSKTFWQFMATVLDKESLAYHIKLNLMPLSVSGLSAQIPVPGFDKADPSSWFPGVKLDFSDVEQVYTWTVATESLKRLDGLLRSSLSIANLIALKAGQNDEAFGGSLLSELKPVVEESSEQASPEAAAALKELPVLNGFHPIVQASEYEARRLADDLFLLASADKTMVDRARGGLMDRFRNALTDIWTGTNLLSEAQDRSLLVKVLRNLENITVIRESNILDYTVVLSLVGRMWSVRLELGSSVLINAVTSRVPTSMIQAEISLSNALSNISFTNVQSSSKSSTASEGGLPRATSKARSRRT